MDPIITTGAPWGRDLRYLLTITLFDRGPLSLQQLISAVESQGVVLPGRASKVVSDALRWEVSRGRVVRLGRGRYGPGAMPRSTAHRIRRRLDLVHQELRRYHEHGAADPC